MTTRRGRLALAILATAGVALIAGELGYGAAHFGRTELADPCTAKATFPGGGIDGAIQRFALSGLNGAACSLHTSREELVLSFSPTSRSRIRWSTATIETALHASFARAARDTFGNGLLGSLAASLLEGIVGRPLQWLLGRTG